MENASTVELIPIPSASPVQNVDISIASPAQTSKPESAINVLKNELQDLANKTRLLKDLNHELIMTMESKIMTEIEARVMESVNRFLSSANPGDLPQSKPKSKALKTGHGTISASVAQT